MWRSDFYLDDYEKKLDYQSQNQLIFTIYGEILSVKSQRDRQKYNNKSIQTRITEG